jgi:hypothetical protein
VRACAASAGRQAGALSGCLGCGAELRELLPCRGASLAAEVQVLVGSGARARASGVLRLRAC